MAYSINSETRIWNIQFNVPTSQSANIPLQGNIFITQGLNSLSTYVVPSGQRIWIDQVYTTGSVNPDAIFQIVKNGTPLQYQPNLNSLVATYNQPIGTLKVPILIESGSILSFYIYLMSANGSTAQTYNVFLKVQVDTLTIS